MANAPLCSADATSIVRCISTAVASAVPDWSVACYCPGMWSTQLPTFQWSASTGALQAHFLPRNSLCCPPLVVSCPSDH